MVEAGPAANHDPEPYYSGWLRHDGQVELVPEDLRIDVWRPFDKDKPSAVQITHLPTGTTVTVDDQPSAHRNRERALELLREALEPGL